MAKININKDVVVKAAGIGATVLGIVGTLVTGWVSSEKQKAAVDAAVDAKFTEYLASQSTKES